MHAEVRKGVNGSISKLAAGLGALACAAAVASGAPDDSGKIIVYVDKSAPAGGDGTSWQSAFRDLQDAIRKQHPNLKDIEMRVAQGVYTPDQGTGDRTEFFRFHGFLGSAVTLSLRGSFAGLQGTDPDKQDYSATRTVLSGDLQGDDGPGFANRSDNSGLIAIIGAQQTLLIDGITVRGASAEQLSGYGGMSAYVQASTVGVGATWLWITNCNFEDNDAGFAPAGGLSASADFIQISHSRFVGNRQRVGSGGGLTLSGYGNLYTCTFDSNAARIGGALYSHDGAYLYGCTLTRNEAEFHGGATFGQIGASASLFVENRAGSTGGAIAAYENLGLVSCTIADNFAPAGSAISLLYGAGNLTNVVVWGNIGALYPVRMIDNIGECSIKNSVLQDGSAGVELSGMSVSFASIVTSDPKFIRPGASSSGIENWNYRLALGSSAKGVGGDDGNLWYGDLDGSVYQEKYGPADAGCYFDTRYICEGNMQPGNLIVDDADFVEFVAAYNMILSPPANPNADFNRDGLVDDADFAIFVVGYDRLICP